MTAAEMPNAKINIISGGLRKPKIYNLEGGTYCLALFHFLIKKERKLNLLWFNLRSFFCYLLSLT